MDAKDRVILLIQRHGLSFDTAKAELGISLNDIMDWEARRSEPSEETLEGVARYFGVSMEWLRTGKEVRPGLSAKEKELLAMWGRLDEEGQENVLSVLTGELRRTEA